MRSFDEWRSKADRRKKLCQAVEALRPQAGLPGNVILFYIVPLDPAYRAGLAGHFPVSVCAIMIKVSARKFFHHTSPLFQATFLKNDSTDFSLLFSVLVICVIVS
jgi:hypothetical protein